jgi:chromate transporter
MIKYPAVKSGKPLITGKAISHRGHRDCREKRGGIDSRPGIAELFLSFFKLGMTAFGGPAMVAYIKELAVDRHRWLDEKTFRDGVVICQSVPGATAMQTAAYVGLRAKGVPGALASFAGFGLPAFILMLTFSSIYAPYHAVAGIASLFKGLQVTVVAIVANATLSFGRSAFRSYRDVVIAVAAAVLLWGGVSPFAVIMGAALAGVAFLSSGDTPDKAAGGKNDRRRLLQLFALLLVPVSALLALYLDDRKLFSLAALMIRIDLFAFGGGFASLPLMLHEIVAVKGWMDNKTFMDGIALGLVTPGPIVITATFVGYFIHGITGAIVATLAVFSPSFLLVVAITPVFDSMKASAYFHGATKGILASFVGLLFFATAKFAVAVPWDVFRVLLACGALGALLKKVGILYVVLITALISAVLL